MSDLLFQSNHKFLRGLTASPFFEVIFVHLSHVLCVYVFFFALWKGKEPVMVRMNYSEAKNKLSEEGTRI